MSGNPDITGRIPRSECQFTDKIIERQRGSELYLFGHSDDDLAAGSAYVEVRAMLPRKEVSVMRGDHSIDNPVKSRDEDEFDRWPFSKRLADAIAAFDASAGAPVFGVFGPWGYGKSTVLNFVREELEREHAGEIAILPFNPWMFGDKDSLLREFNKELAKALGRSMSGDAEEPGEAESIEEMRGAKRKVVVLIDDLDRPGRDEILTMLRLVRLAANFPQVVYLLAFDDEMVARAACFRALAYCWKATKASPSASP